MATTYTPIRYPGGKTKIYPEMHAIMVKNDLIGKPYAEVFAGGAGLAVKLLLKGDVSSIAINDFDRAVYCMWNAIVNDSDEICNFIDESTLDVQTWLAHREVYRNKESANALDLAKSSLYLNRTNVSGILGGGIIGGLDQTGNYKMDVRFNRETLKRKIRRIAERKNDITVTCLDAEQFVDEVLASDRYFAYFDPPYVQKGPGLYRSSFDEVKHRSLAKKISDCKGNWVVTYDADTLIEDIYRDFRQEDLDVSYTANVKTVGKEKIILGPGLEWPECLTSGRSVIGR